MEVIVVVRVVKEAVKLLTALRAVQAVRVAVAGKLRGAGTSGHCRSRAWCASWVSHVPAPRRRSSPWAPPRGPSPPDRLWRGAGGGGAGGHTRVGTGAGGWWWVGVTANGGTATLRSCGEVGGEGWCGRGRGGERDECTVEAWRAAAAHLRAGAGAVGGGRHPGGLRTAATQSQGAGERRGTSPGTAPRPRFGQRLGATLACCPRGTAAAVVGMAVP